MFHLLQGWYVHKCRKEKTMMTFEVSLYVYNVKIQSKIHGYLEFSKISQSLKASTNLGGKYNLIPNVHN